MGRFLRKYAWLIVTFFFCILAVAAMNIHGFRFSACVFWCCAGLVVVYRLLRMLKQRKPRLAKALRTVLTVFLCLGLVLAAVTGVLIGTACRGNADIPCDYVIVLGAGVNGTQPSLILSERINSAYTYLSDHPHTIAVLSGGQGSGEDISEAQCMFLQLTARGIDPDRLWLEDQSTSTRENLRFSRALIEEKTGMRPNRAAIISNEFHLFRAGLFAREQGIEMIGVPAKTTWVALRVNYFLREIVAVWYYVLSGG